MSECREEKKNKILVLANNDVGLYQFRHELLQALLDKGYEVVISLPDGKMIAPLIELGCRFIDTPVDRRGINPKTDLKLFNTYRKILREELPDLVITYTIKPNIYGGFACRMMRIPYAANITGIGTAFQKEGMLKTLVTGMYQFALKKAKTVFFENDENMKLFYSLKICTENNSRLLNGAGVNLDHYSVQPYPETDTTHFLFIGRVMKEKGIDELFDAMKKLKNDGEKCVLDIVGPYEDNYEDIIRKYSAEGWLNYHGYQKDVRPFIRDAHCFVLPSWHEGMANTNLECAASGRPIITSNIPGCREAVIDGESGFLCESMNSDSLYAAMKRFLSLPQEARAEMGKAGRRHMEAVFDKKMVVSKTINGLGI